MNATDIYATKLDSDFQKFSTLYEALLNEWEIIAKELPELKHAYEMAHAKAVKKAEGTIQAREVEARLATDGEYLALLKAETKLEFIKAKVKWADKELSILQTRAATMRSEMQMTNLPQPRWGGQTQQPA